MAGDDVADLVVRYAALLSQQNTADSLEIEAFETTGAATTVTLLLNDGLALVTESVDSTLAEPDNAPAERYLRSRIDDLLRRQNPPYDEIAAGDIWNVDQPG